MIKLSLEVSRSLNVIDEKGMLVWHRKFDQKVFDRLLRLFELLPDEDALKTLDGVIGSLEAPKLEVARQVSKALAKDGKMVDLLKEALTALPMKQLKELDSKLASLKMKREPGGDCLVIEDGEKSHRLNL